MKSIVLKLAGPLQSWGTNSYFETRHTDLYPSKSAVIGIIAASMGYLRGEDDKIQKLNELEFALRIDQNGQLLRDYHTARKYKKNGDFDRTYVTNRYYIEDAVFVVAIGSEDEAFIEKISEGLQNPYFQPFMGRRSLPLTADFYLGIKDCDVVTTLKEYPWQARIGYRKGCSNLNSNSNRLSIYADANLLDKGIRVGERKDRVISFSQKSRRFGFRAEIKIEVPVVDAVNVDVSDINRDGYGSTEHDAFTALGE